MCTQQCGWAGAQRKGAGCPASAEISQGQGGAKTLMCVSTAPSGSRRAVSGMAAWRRRGWQEVRWWPGQTGGTFCDIAIATSFFRITNEQCTES